MQKLPPTVKALIEALNAEFPHKCPSPAQSERDIWMYAGKRALVDYLLSVAEASRVRIDRSASLDEDEQEDPEGD